MSLHRALLPPRSLSRRAWLLLIIGGLLIGVGGIPSSLRGQTPRGAGPRVLAPGVLTVIPPAIEEQETVTGPVALVEITEGMKDLDWTPHYLAKSDTIYAMAQNVFLRRHVWALEFAFKPVRMIYVDVPQPTGRLERKLIWYMVFRVRNPGRHLAPEAKDDGFGNKLYGTSAVNFSRRFFPQFALRSHEFDKEYLDRIIPAAIPLIQQREDPNTRLYSTVEISQVNIPVDGGPDDHGVWGVATWEDVDPRIDFFSVYVQGLTNAQKFLDPPGAYKKGDPPGTGRLFASKELQLNFWRPGDMANPTEGEIRYGLPSVEADERAHYLALYGQTTWVDYQWVYR